jgi:hypothetical protein
MLMCCPWRHRYSVRISTAQLSPTTRNRPHHLDESPLAMIWGIGRTTVKVM